MCPNGHMKIYTNLIQSRDISMNTNKVNRVEVINWTKSLEEGGGRDCIIWDEEEKIKVKIELQDDDRTLKIFIDNIN